MTDVPVEAPAEQVEETKPVVKPKTLAERELEQAERRARLETERKERLAKGIAERKERQEKLEAERKAKAEKELAEKAEKEAKELEAKVALEKEIKEVFLVDFAAKVEALEAAVAKCSSRFDDLKVVVPAGDLLTEVEVLKDGLETIKKELTEAHATAQPFRQTSQSKLAKLVSPVSEEGKQAKEEIKAKIKAATEANKQYTALLKNIKDQLNVVEKPLDEAKEKVQVERAQVIKMCKGHDAAVLEKILQKATVVKEKIEALFKEDEMDTELASLNKAVEAMQARVTQERERLEKIAQAKREKEEALQNSFNKWDLDRDGKLNSKEIANWGKEEHGIELTEAHTAKILSQLDPERAGGVKIERFNSLRVKLCILKDTIRSKEKEELRIREREQIPQENEGMLVQAEAEMAKILEVEADLKLCDDPAELPALRKRYEEARASHVKLQPILRGNIEKYLKQGGASSTIKGQQEKMKKFDVQLRGVLTLFNNAVADIENRRNVMIAAHVNELEVIIKEVATVEIGSYIEIRQKFDDASKAKVGVLSEEDLTLQQKQMESACKAAELAFLKSAIRAYIEEESITIDTLEEMLKDKTVVEFLKEMPKLVDYYDEIENGTIFGNDLVTKEHFLSMAKIFYKVLAPAELQTEQTPADGKLIRKLASFEHVFALCDEIEEDGIARLKVRTEKDGKDGWVTVKNKTRKFLQLLNSAESDKYIEKSLRIAANKLRMAEIHRKTQKTTVEATKDVEVVEVAEEVVESKNGMDVVEVEDTEDTEVTEEETKKINNKRKEPESAVEESSPKVARTA